MFSRVKYAAKHLLTGIMHYYKQHRNKDLMLRLANAKTSNTEAEAFYQKVGFVKLISNIYVTNESLPQPFPQTPKQIKYISRSSPKSKSSLTRTLRGGKR